MTKAIVAHWRSSTTRGLANGLRVPLVTTRQTARRHVDGDIVINWGTSYPLFIRHNARILNNPDAVAVACSKLYSLRQLYDKKVPCLTFSEDKNDALKWLEDGSSVVCRDILNGRSGKGVRIIKRFEWHRQGRPEPDFGRARLFTRYFPKKREVRVHVAGDRVLAVAEKLRKRGFTDRNNWVRNHDNGWVFAEPLSPTGDAGTVAKDAVLALGLDFGAADIGIDSDGNAVVIEVNTAPGLEGRTLEAYLRYFNSVNG